MASSNVRLHGLVLLGFAAGLGLGSLPPTAPTRSRPVRTATTQR